MTTMLTAKQLGRYYASAWVLLTWRAWASRCDLPFGETKQHSAMQSKDQWILVKLIMSLGTRELNVQDSHVNVQGRLEVHFPFKWCGLARATHTKGKTSSWKTSKFCHKYKYGEKCNKTKSIWYTNYFPQRESYNSYTPLNNLLLNTERNHKENNE